MFVGPATVTVAVHGGAGTLLGQPGEDRQDLIPVATRLVWDIDGVADVVDRTSERRTCPWQHEPA